MLFVLILSLESSPGGHQRAISSSPVLVDVWTLLSGLLTFIHSHFFSLSVNR